jgi:hypothetical protein
MANRTGISRRSFMSRTAGAGAALASAFAAPAGMAQAGKSIRIGVLNSFTGAIGYAAENNLKACRSISTASAGASAAARSS